jgi:hypothetical protein
MNHHQLSIQRASKHHLTHDTKGHFLVEQMLQKIATKDIFIMQHGSRRVDKTFTYGLVAQKSMLWCIRLFHQR